VLVYLLNNELQVLLQLLAMVMSDNLWIHSDFHIRLCRLQRRMMATSAEDGISCISGETLEKARRELGEDPKTRGAVIPELRDKIEQWEPSPEEDGLTFSRKDDKFLLRYLRAKKFDTDRALQLYVNYHKYRKKYEQGLGEVFPKAAEHILKTGLLSVLPERSRSGCKVVVIRAVLWDPETMTPGESVKSVLLLLDRLIEDEETQVHGFELVEDLDGVSFYNVFRISRNEHMRKGILVELIQVHMSLESVQIFMPE